MMKTGRLAVLAGLVILVETLSCSGRVVLDPPEFLEEWRGTRSYDQVLSRLGPPSAIAEGEHVFVAVWDIDTSHVVVFEGGSPRALRVERGRRLVLTFDRESRKLVDWSYAEW